MPGESVDTSVLEEFTTAKRKIGEIFEDIDQQVEAVQVRDLRTPSRTVCKLFTWTCSEYTLSQYETFIETVQKQDTDYVLQTNVMNS